MTAPLIPRVTPIPSFTGRCPAPTCAYTATGRTVPAVLAAMGDHEGWHWNQARLRAIDRLPHTTD